MAAEIRVHINLAKLARYQKVLILIANQEAVLRNIIDEYDYYIYL